MTLLQKYFSRKKAGKNRSPAPEHRPAVPQSSAALVYAIRDVCDLALYCGTYSAGKRRRAVPGGRYDSPHPAGLWHPFRKRVYLEQRNFPDRRFGTGKGIMHGSSISRFPLPISTGSRRSISCRVKSQRESIRYMKRVPSLNRFGRCLKKVNGRKSSVPQSAAAHFVFYLAAQPVTP